MSGDDASAISGPRRNCWRDGSCVGARRRGAVLPTELRSSVPTDNIVKAVSIGVYVWLLDLAAVGWTDFSLGLAAALRRLGYF